MKRIPVILARIDAELKAGLLIFRTEPLHDLDVQRCAMAVAPLASIGPVRHCLSTTVDLAPKHRLSRKGIKPSYNEKGNTGWVGGNIIGIKYVMGLLIGPRL